ncbi:hypothetical protein AB0M72_25470 [Nocardiopsis dassonvillei]
MRIGRTLALGSAISVALVGALSGSVSASTVESAADNWTCEINSYPSSTDPGGRDAVITVRHVNDSTNFARVRFQAHGEIFTFINSTNPINGNGDRFRFETEANEVNGDWSWWWFLSRLDAIEDNLSLPEDQQFSLELWSNQANTGPCMNRGGRT